MSAMNVGTNIWIFLDRIAFAGLLWDQLGSAQVNNLTPCKNLLKISLKYPFLFHVTLSAVLFSEYRTKPILGDRIHR